MKYGRELRQGDVLIGRDDLADFVPGGVIEDVRPRSAGHPLTVAVKVGGAWYPLADEGRYEA